MTKYNVSPLVAREIEFSTGTIFGGSWCRYFISITLHQCYIEATWKTRPKNDLDGHKEIFNSLQEYLDWFANLKKTYGRRISRRIRSLGQVSRGKPMENLSLTCKYNASLLAHRELPIILY